MSNGIYERIGRLALSGLCLAALSGFAPLALAQTPTPPTASCGSTTPGGTGVICTQSNVGTGQTCGYDRGGTGCTANDFVGNANVTSNTITACHIGDTITGQALTFAVTSSSATRYAPGVFISEQNLPLNQTGGSCSVATFPTTSTLVPARTPFPWFAANVGDVCGSYQANFTSEEELDGVTLKCEPDANGNLGITFMVVYAQNSNGAATCTGPANVAPGTSSKCTFGGTPVTNVVVTYNANPTCSKTLTYDPVAGTVTTKFTITNNGPDDAGLAGSGAVSFEDIVPAPIVVTGATCGNPLNGATCPASVANTGNDVTGTIPTLPNGGSVDITITGTVAGGLTDVISNTATLSINGTAVIVPAQWANTCTGGTTLPVKLQSFDVH